MTDAHTDIPRPEYPRPQFRRDRWLNLNGTWGFEIDRGDSGLERGLRDAELAGEILVPFAPESTMSGIGDLDFHHSVWYRRALHVPAEWAGMRVLLHFGAVDHDATVWVDGVEVGRHRGGFSSFTFDVTDAARFGEDVPLVVRARDEPHAPQARGKQGRTYEPFGAHYWRTTGIWQTVWVEPVPEAAIRRPRITPNLAGGSFDVEVPLSANVPGARVAVIVSDGSGEVVRSEVRADLDLAPRLTLPLPEDRRRLWSPADPFLYDLRFELTAEDGRVLDTVDSYAGLRSVSITGKAIRINGEVVFQRLVLDQGYYPDTLMTAPTDADLVRDIELSLAAGFNGARLHEKVFEERYLYHADRLGYLVWGEFGDWGCNSREGESTNQQPDASFVQEWLEVLERDYSHPAIIGWCPMNETWQAYGDRITALDDVMRGMFLATKAYDTSRPVLDTSGYAHRIPESDVFDSHQYEQDPAEFAAHFARLSEGDPFVNPSPTTGESWSIPYRGQPFFVSEFGGIWWNAAEADATESSGWGYGERVRNLEEFYARFEGQIAALSDHPDMFGYCYTQLTDVFQEQNGLYHFDRSDKFDVARLRAAQTRPAAIVAVHPELGGRT
ncbi:glycoside hydrolase family 2 protein [Agromyces aerolatus]|uniref:glycoside hydrolase family 2 protein n=1 Tax=Agromyces sp. LY-1074 TaxID=3074080 RepID=UPI00285BC4ED|nr:MULTISPECIES: sugar-binding domain-containing protein [unclassified Agromyces]MDR5700805.1 glycoside hydrolase family 2 TIM barrel-domain containing protein [Agromyces sp. LY-1074]MDR5707326.1 glycoside hydrolase family 2 TIM barrel-domain containing protein [Agromyces sp. LY-1358]